MLSSLRHEKQIELGPITLEGHSLSALSNSETLSWPAEPPTDSPG